jgi:pyruvate,water dikinase
MKLVVWFDEVGKDDVGLVGGKGANLGELTRAGLPVPPGFIVTADAYSGFLRASGLQPQIEQRLAGLDVGDNAALQRTAGEIKQAMIDAAMPAGTASEIERAYERMSGGPVAVRSSATAEDLADASFAGQQSTFLNVTGAGVAPAVQACWASLFEPQAIAYRARRGYEHLRVGIAVVVQRMVQSQRSGVIFTMHPVTGDPDKIVIEAVYGLGEAAVSGVVTPDFYVVDQPTLTIAEKTVARQERQLVRSQDAASGEGDNAWVPMSPDLGRQQKLTDEEILAIAGLARRVEEHYGSPQDIEWAEEDGSFFVVQSRPVTTASMAD